MNSRMSIYFQEIVGLNQSQFEYVSSIFIRIAQTSH